MPSDKSRPKPAEILDPQFWADSWQAARADSSIQIKDTNQDQWVTFWNSISEIYRRRIASEKTLVEKICNLLDEEGLLSKDAVVLDIGCGPGTFSLPFARRVKQVIALDPAEKMIAALFAEAALQGLNNITPLCQSWAQYEDEAAVDLVFASFSPGINSADSLMKMNRHCRGSACLVTFSRLDEFKIRDELWQEITGKPCQSYAYHIIFPFNYLYVSGFRPRLKFIRESLSYEESLEDMIAQYENYFTLFLNVKPKHRKIIHRYFAQKAVSGLIKREVEREVAVMWWSKKS